MTGASRTTGGFRVTQDHIDTFARDGAVKLEQPFGPEWMDGLVAAFAEIQALHAEGRYGGDIFRQQGRLEITGAVGFHPFVRRWALESPAAEICARVMGSRRIRLYTDHDVAFGKAGEADSAQIGATSFHIDGSAWGFRGEMVPSFWLALDDVDMDRGPLVAAAGSHRKMDRLFLPTPVDPTKPVPAGYAPYSEMQGFLDTHKFEMKVFPARRGDVVMLNPHVVHGSLPMRVAGSRLALSTRWLGDDAVWRVDPHTVAGAGDARDGDLPQEDAFPVIWDVDTGPRGHLPQVQAVHTLKGPKDKMFYQEFDRLETQGYVA